MQQGLIVSDTGPIFSLAVISQLTVLDKLFNEVYIPTAVWEELTRDASSSYFQPIARYFEHKVRPISSSNELTFIMDYGESEALLLCKELQVEYLLIDDKKARAIAENAGVQCIGTIGILSTAKERGLISELRPLFLTFISNKRYYSLKLLNAILKQHGEADIKQ
ncbi:MAG: DUF3368 domain-containing protein [Bacteroidota bacterium]